MTQEDDSLGRAAPKGERTAPNKRQEAMAYLEAARMESLQDYLARGRALQTLSDQDALAHWKIAFHALAANIMDGAARAAETEAAWELALRRIAQPFTDPDIAPAFESMAAQFEATMADLGATKRAEIDVRIAEDMDLLLGRNTAPRN